MRPIKFRAWDEDSNFMEYFEDFREWTCLEDAEHFYNKAGDGLIWMQYTGLKDENGKEIYEGDVYCNDWGCGDCTQKTIEWEKGGFFLGDNHLIDINWSSWYYIGNIYQNPKLLEK